MSIHQNRAGRARLRLSLLAGLTLVAALACAKAADLDQRIAELRSQQDEGRAAETLEPLIELSRLHPEHEEISFRLGVAMVAVGRPTEALFPLQKAAASETLGVTAGIVLASTYAKTGNHAEALRAADKVLEREPENETAMVLRAAAAVELHDGEAALAAADTLVERAPDNRTYRFLRASALGEIGQLDEAEALYRELIADAPQDQAQAAARACQELVRFLINKRHDPDHAVSTVRECIADHPDDPNMAGLLAGFLKELERRDDLLALLEDALEEHPDSPQLRESLIEELVAADRIGEAKDLTEKWAGESDAPGNWLQVARLRHRAGDRAGALEAVQRVISLSPAPEDELRFFEAELMLEQGRYDEAEEKLAGLEKQLYKDVLTARLAQERGDPKTALEIYKRVAIDWPQNYGIRVLAARAAFSLGDIERAKTDLQEATRAAPKDTDAALWLARVFFWEGNYGQAIAYASRHLKERGPIDPGAHLLIAQSLAAGNRMPQALEMLDRLENVRDGEFRSIAWAAAARLVSVEEPAAALAELESSLDGAKLDLGDPVHAAALDQLFDLQVQNGKQAATAKRIDALLAKHPNSAHLHALKGRLALLQGDLAGAEAAFSAALALDAAEGLALSGDALLLQAKGDLPGAIARMNEAAQAAPGRGEYAYMTAGLVLASGDRAGAMQRYEAILRDHPDQAGAANDLAFLLAEDSTDLARAQQYAERAIRLKPSAETLDTLGFVKLRQGAVEEAVGLFERALARKPDYGTARYHLALALMEKGDAEAARAALDQALAKPFPEEQEARKVLARIDSGEGRP